MMQTFLEALKRNYYLIVVMVFSSFFAATNFIWVVMDLAPPPWDPAWYLQNSQELYHALIKGGVPALVKAFPHALGGVKAPLIPILPLPFYLLFGSGENSALCVNILFLFITSYYLFKLACLTDNKRVAIIAVLVTHTIPLYYAVCRIFFVEYVQSALVIMYIYHLVKSNYFSVRRHNVLQGIIIGFGLLAKITFPLYVVGPIFYCLWWNIKNNKTGWLALLKEVLLICSIGAVIAATFYAPNLGKLLSFVYLAGFSETAKYYGMGDPFSIITIMKYWRHLSVSVISSYYSIAFVISGLLLIIQVKSKHLSSKPDANFVSNKLYLLWFIIPFTVFTFGVNKEVRYILPILPVLSIMIGVSFDRFFKRVTSDVLFVFIVMVLIAYPVYSMIQNSFNPKKSGNFSYVTPPDKNNWKVKEIIQYVYSEAGRIPFVEDKPSNYVVVAIEHPAVNANTYDYISSATWQYLYTPVHFTSLGYAEFDIDKAVNRVVSLKPLFMVFAEGIPKKELTGFLNSLNDRLKLLVDSGQIGFVYDKTFELQNGVRIVLYKRINGRI